MTSAKNAVTDMTNATIEHVTKTIMEHGHNQLVELDEVYQENMGLMESLQDSVNL